MKKFSVLVLTLAFALMCASSLIGCKQDDVLHLGLNATIVEIDSEGRVVYVADLGKEEVFGERCAIDCSNLIEIEGIIYVDYESHGLSAIQFDDLTVGDEVIINAYESQLDRIANGGAAIEVDQIQLGTQRLS